MVQAAGRAFANAYEYAKPQLIANPRPQVVPPPQPVACASQTKCIRDPKPMPAEEIKPVRDIHPIPPGQIKRWQHKKPLPWEQIKPQRDPRPMPPVQIKPDQICPVGPPIKVEIPCDAASDQAASASTGGIKPIRCHAKLSACAADLYTAQDLYFGNSYAEENQVGVGVVA